ncbi:MAG: hypothetical protein GY804_09000 [Alphaproteobacteria bacterium]|nr:hypothetical protein [Alphaproteobacteria bacterium]
MSKRQILLDSFNIKDILDKLPTEGDGPLDTAISAKGFFDTCQEIHQLILQAGGGLTVESINSEVITALEQQRIIIENNIADLTKIKNIINNRYIEVTENIQVEQDKLDAFVPILQDLSSIFETARVKLIEIKNKINSSVYLEFFELTLEGSNKYLYPVWWAYEAAKFCRIVIKRTGSDENDGLYLDFTGIGGAASLDNAQSMWIDQFTDQGNIYAKWLSLKMCAYTATESQMDFIGKMCSGLYLRGNTTYKIYVESEVVKQQIINNVALGQLAVQELSIPEQTIYMGQMFSTDLTPVDEYLKIENAIQRAPVLGDTSVLLGGHNELNTLLDSLSRVVPSTGEQLSVQGSLTEATYGIATGSNGALDNYFVDGGYDPVDVRVNTLYKGIVSTGTALTQHSRQALLLCYASGDSNGTDDLYINLGGYTGGAVINDKISTGIISTGTETVLTTGVLSKPIFDSSSISSDTNNILLLIAGCDISSSAYGSDIEQKVVINTQATSEINTNLSMVIRGGVGASTGILDKGCLVGGYSTNYTHLSSAEEYIISSNTRQTRPNTLQENRHHGTCIDNKIGGSACYIAGSNGVGNATLVATITKFSLTTYVTSEVVGSLPERRGYPSESGNS